MKFIKKFRKKKQAKKTIKESNNIKEMVSIVENNEFEEAFDLKELSNYHDSSNRDAFCLIRLLLGEECYEQSKIIVELFHNFNKSFINDRPKQVLNNIIHSKKQIININDNAMSHDSAIRFLDDLFVKSCKLYFSDDLLWNQAAIKAESDGFISDTKTNELLNK